MITQKEINRYIKDIKKELLYSSKQSREFLAGLRQNVCDFAAENENADMETVKEQFGTPEEIAKVHISELAPVQIKNKVNIRKVVIAVTIAVIILLSFFITGTLINFYGDGHGSISVTLEEETTIYLD